MNTRQLGHQMSHVVTNLEVVREHIISCDGGSEHKADSTVSSTLR